MSIECGYCGNKVHDRDCPKYDMDLSDPLAVEIAALTEEQRAADTRTREEDRISEAQEKKMCMEEVTIKYTESSAAFDARLKALKIELELDKSLPSELKDRLRVLQEDFETAQAKSPLTFDEFDRLKAQKDAIEAKNLEALKEKFLRVQSPASEEKEKDTNVEKPFEPGDLANLRSQPYILMTVEKRVDGDEHDVHCVWLTDKRNVRRGKFPSCVLRHR